jgi:hypothetical protein
VSMRQDTLRGVLQGELQAVLQGVLQGVLQAERASLHCTASVTERVSLSVTEVSECR